MQGGIGGNQYYAAWNNKVVKDMYGKDWGIGSWSGNTPQDPIDPYTNTELGPPLRIHGPNQDEIEHFNINRLLLKNIQRNDFFKSLAKYRTVDEIIDEIYEMAQNTGENAHKGADACPWVQGTHSSKSAGGMCSQIRGVATSGRPTNTWMYLVKLMTLRPTARQIKKMLTHPDSPYIRIVAIFFIRYTQPQKQLLEWLKDSLLDDEPLRKQKLDKHTTTVNAIVAQILTSHKYEDEHLPRLPPLVQRECVKYIRELGIVAAKTAQRSGASRGGGGTGGMAHPGRRGRSRSPRGRNTHPRRRSRSGSNGRSRDRGRRDESHRSRSRGRGRDRRERSGSNSRKRTEARVKDSGHDRGRDHERGREHDRGHHASEDRHQSRRGGRDRDRSRRSRDQDRSHRDRDRGRRDRDRSHRDRDRDRRDRSR